MLPAGNLVPTAWLYSGLRYMETPFHSNVRQSPASQLRQGLRPQERHLQDLTSRAASLSAELDVFQETGFTGLWRKDKEHSDSMEDAYDAINLPWLYRRAITFLNDLVVEDTEDHFKTTMKAGGVMDVVEQYPWSGETVIHGRRDKRKGLNEGCIERTIEGPQLRLRWTGMYGGHATDRFTLENNSQTLIHTTTMAFDADEKVHTYRTVYHRQKPQRRPSLLHKQFSV